MEANIGSSFHRVRTPFCSNFEGILTICSTVLHSFLHSVPHKRQLVNVHCLLLVRQRVDIRYELDSGDVCRILNECVVCVAQAGENWHQIHGGVVGHLVVHLQVLKTCSRKRLFFLSRNDLMRLPITSLIKGHE